MNSAFRHFFVGAFLAMLMLAAPAPTALAARETVQAANAPIDLTPDERVWLSQHPVVRVAGPCGFPPFFFYDNKGEAQGISADTMRAIAGMLGLELKVLPNLPWREVLQKIQDKELDWIPCAARSPAREQYMAFSQPYLSFPLVIISSRDSGFIGGVQDLQNKRIAGVKDNAVWDWIEGDGVSVNPVIAQSPLEALRAVSKGQADAALDNLASAVYNIDHHGLSNLKIAAPTAYDGYDLHFAVRKDWPELLSILDKALAAMPTGQRDAIRSKWLSIRYEHGFQLWDILFWGAVSASAAGLLTAVFFFWNRRLQREIVQRVNAEKRLDKSVSILRETIRQAPFALAILERKEGAFHVVMENAEYRRILDKPEPRPDEPDGKTPEDRPSRFFTLDGKTEIPAASTPASRALAGEMVENERLLVRRKNGGDIPVEASASPVLGEDSQISAVFLSFRDISKRLKAEKSQMQARKMEAIGTLAGGVAHDFNNMLSIIIGNAEIAMEDVDKQSPVQANLSEIRSASLRARDVIRQLLQFSRRSPSRKKPVVLASVVKDALSLLRATLPSSIEMQTDFKDHGELVLADPTQIQQMLINLASNAAQAMEDSGGVLKVSLEAVNISPASPAPDPSLGPGPHLKLEVTDSGRGMSREILERMFDPYFTTQETGKGSGMGLSVVQGIVQSHGGVIKVQSARGKGSTLSIWLPVHAAQPDEKAPGERTALGRKARVLLVDDEPAVAFTAQMMLERLGCEVLAFRDSTQALELFRARPEHFDVVVTDMTMPCMNGDALAQKIMEIRPGLPVVLCTGFSEKMDRQRAESLGLAAFVMKPLTLAALAGILEDVLAKGGSLEDKKAG